MIPLDLAILAPLYLILMGVAASFSALETALFSLRERGGAPPGMMPEGSSTLSAMFRDALASLPEVLLLGGIANLLLAATGLYLITEPLAELGWNPWVSGAFVYGTSLIVVELIPRTLALRSPRTVANRALPLFLRLRSFMEPLSAPLHAVSEFLIARLTPNNAKHKRDLSGEELETLVQMRTESGAISSEEAALIQGIVGLRALSAREAMTPRIDLPLMPHDASDEEAANMLEATRHPFVAVFDEKMDAIAHLLPVQAWKLSGRPHWTLIAQTPVFVPKSVSVLDIWNRHLKEDGSAAVVVDEYGGFEGLLSHASVVERILAKAAPTQQGLATIQPIGAGRYLVAGTALLDDLERDLDVVFPESTVDTIGGLVMDALGYPPKPGELLQIGPVEVRVKRTSRARVQQVELRVTEKEDAPV